MIVCCRNVNSRSYNARQFFRWLFFTKINYWWGKSIIKIRVSGYRKVRWGSTSFLCTLSTIGNELGNEVKKRKNIVVRFCTTRIDSFWTHDFRKKYLEWKRSTSTIILLSHMCPNIKYYTRFWYVILKNGSVGSREVYFSYRYWYLYL